MKLGNEEKFVAKAHSQKLLSIENKTEKRFCDDFNKNLKKNWKGRSSDTITIFYQFAKYKKGNRFMRFLSPFLGYNATVVVIISFMNENNKLVGQMNVQAVMMNGMFGGASNDVFIAVIDKVVEYIRKVKTDGEG